MVLARFCLFTLALVLFTAPVMAAGLDGAVIPPRADFSPLRLNTVATVRQILTPLRLELSDGRILSLPGIDVPGMDPHNPGDIAVAATTFLKDLLDNKQVRLYVTKDRDKGRVNRMGDILANLERNDGAIWVQGILLANGLARVYPSERNTGMAKQMLALEASAREKGLGLWADKANAVLTPETAGQALHTMAIVEGTIKTVGTYRNRIFLNFGDNWRTDFTVGISPVVRRLYARNNIDPLQFAHKRVRIHGWVRDYNGPYIDLANPVWLEFLPDSSH